MSSGSKLSQKILSEQHRKRYSVILLYAILMILVSVVALIILFMPEIIEYLFFMIRKEADILALHR